MDSLAQVSQPTSPGRGDYFHSNGGFRSKKRRGDRPGLTSDSRPIVFTLRMMLIFVQKCPHKCTAVQKSNGFSAACQQSGQDDECRIPSTG